MQLSDNKRIFHHLLANTLLAAVTNAFVWFALTFWVYLETKSVMATSLIAGIFALANMFFAVFFGGVVDHHGKRNAMLASSVVSLLCYSLGTAIFFATPREAFLNAATPQLWLMVVVLMVGSVAGNLRMIALSTVVTFLFEENKDKANGMIGAVNGVSFTVTSVLSGLAIGFTDMDVALLCATGATALALGHLLAIRFSEPERSDSETDSETDSAQDASAGKLDVRGTIRVIREVPGLFALIFFTTFNNFLGGVFMGLMDAYGLSLVSVQTWGTMFAVLSLGFIAGSSWIARHGLGPRPVRQMLLLNCVMWLACCFFTIQPSVVLLATGMLMWMVFTPFVEATEQTVIQTVVPFDRQGRVFGFAQSIEHGATPITAFLVGPIAQYIFIPFMTTGAGVELIGGWFGTGPDRGMALVFTLSGLVGFIVTLFAFTTRSYRVLSRHYAERSRVKLEPAPEAA
jgi:DHA3 family multidrug efflux protein-like MFS transporter